MGTQESSPWIIRCSMLLYRWLLCLGPTTYRRQYGDLCTGYLEYPFQKRATLLALPIPFLVISLPTRWQEDAPHGYFPLDL